MDSSPPPPPPKEKNKNTANLPFRVNVDFGYIHVSKAGIVRSSAIAATAVFNLKKKTPHNCNYAVSDRCKAPPGRSTGTCNNVKEEGERFFSLGFVELRQASFKKSVTCCRRITRSRP